MENTTTVVTKGIIVSLPALGENIFKVRVPLYEDNTNKELTFNAVACVQPGLSGGYVVGDVVFVTYEDNVPNTFVILGKLYRPEVSNDGYGLVTGSDGGVSSVKLTANTITVEHSAKLPENTSLGSIMVDSLKTLIQKVQKLG